MESGKHTAFWGAVGTVGAAVVLWIITPVGEYVEGAMRSFLASQFGEPDSENKDSGGSGAASDGSTVARAEPATSLGAQGSAVAVDASGTGDKSANLAAGMSSAVAAKLDRSVVVDRIEYSVGRQSATLPRNAAIGLTLFAGSSQLDCGDQNIAFRTSAELANKIAERANRALAASQQGEKLTCS